MKYLKKFNESKSRFLVKIEVEHGDAKYKIESYSFDKEDDRLS